MIFSFHYVRTGVWTTLRALSRPPSRAEVSGLVHAECMTRMTLGAPLLSPERIQLRHLTLFAAWENSDALDEFLANTRLGRVLASGWHVRMSFVRRWGHVDAFGDLPERIGSTDPSHPVVAVTFARMRLPEVPRFIHWGRPVEALVRDHPGTTLAMAAVRFPRTVSTFTIWSSQEAMLSMVRGHGGGDRPGRHAEAMAERERRDFHHQFTTLRFLPLSEHGTYDGRTGLVPGL
ncbi:MAG: hypothetical protein J0L84_19775 [Verrucomicrobia bacterium]|nr:hypothetical protein [Verrucomicrobiota bacterium]